MGTLIFAIALALVLGFAAHRASVCTVRAVAEIMSSSSGSIFLSIGKSMLWAWALMIPVFALTPAAGTGLAGWSLTGVAVFGGAKESVSQVKSSSISVQLAVTYCRRLGLSP